MIKTNSNLFIKGNCYFNAQKFNRPKTQPRQIYNRFATCSPLKMANDSNFGVDPININYIIPDNSISSSSDNARMSIFNEPNIEPPTYGSQPPKFGSEPATFGSQFPKQPNNYLNQI